MPKVFVHGNPECDAVWAPLVRALAVRGVEDVVLLSPPGFGAPVPDGFEPTMEGYHRWLAAELADIEGDVDLVGHDWGAGHVAGIAADRPELIRSFAMDCGGLLHADYEWHDAAVAWQTPEVGEQVVAAMVDLPRDDRLTMINGLGIDGSTAEAIADAMTPVMGECILTLYRSAAQPAMAELGARVRAASPRPALVLVADGDTYVPADLAMEAAQELGAEVARFADQGHWWMLGDPDGAAEVLCSFWAGLDR